MLAIGKLISTFGVHGGIKVKSFSGELEHFKKLVNQIVLLKQDLKETKIKVLKCELKGDTPVLYFEGYDSPEIVKKFSSAEIWVERNFASKLETGEYYMRDLIGLNVIFNGEVMGQVISFMETSSILLEVEKADGKNFWLPFLNHFVGEINLEQKTIEMLNDESM